MDKSPTCWKRPSDVMRMHSLKRKKKALQARIENRNDILDVIQSDIGFRQIKATTVTTSFNRSNVFKANLTKRLKPNAVTTTDLDESTDNTLFQLLNKSSQSNHDTSINSMFDSFANILEKAESSQIVHIPIKKKLVNLPIDWSLKSRIRFFSKKPFLWSKTLKTLEEASGTTGFTRCLNLSAKDCNASPSVDTGLNAQFHQNSLVWQHPVLPWLNLFPRNNTTSSKSTEISIPLDKSIKECLHKLWRDSFRSLLQLVRSHQCPYFYLCANKFTCLFRAAGMGGQPEIHCIITPTTSGFRTLLQKDEIVYTMPLKKENTNEKKRSISPTTTRSPQSSDLGYDTLDSADKEIDSDDDDDEEEDDGETDEWLQSMGVKESEIKLNSSQAKKSVAKKLSQIDKLPDSLVLIEKDEEVQALFNLLLNCQSIISPTGPLAGIPPTLLSPVAFHGATLRPLTTSHRTVTMNGEKFQCVEMLGPILPHTIRDLCAILEPIHEQFSISCSTLEHTKAFTMLSSNNNEPLILDVFSRENLRDCGLKPQTLQDLCKLYPMQILESVKYTDNQYFCEN